jgi:hypothetical protein
VRARQQKNRISMRRCLTHTLLGSLSLLWLAELGLWLRSGWERDAWTWQRVRVFQSEVREEVELAVCSDADGLALSHSRLKDQRRGDWRDRSRVSTTLRHQSTLDNPRLYEEIWQKRLGPRRFGTFTNHWTAGGRDMWHVGLVLPHFAVLSLLTLAWVVVR